MTAVHRAAIWYAKHGLPVFPLIPRQKEPITQHGFKDATKDLTTIERWWEETPDANIGIPMGAPSRLLLFDVDFWATKGRLGSRDDVIEHYGEIPDTAEVVTGRGRHFYFRLTSHQASKEIDKGIEIKGDGGYAVAPPSVHPNGKTYAFDGLDDKAILHPAAPPIWLIEKIAGANRARSKSKTETTEEKWPPGERNTRLTSLAGKLRYAGLSEEAIAAALLKENRLRCDPPLTDTEVKQIAQSIGQYPAGPTNPRYAEINLDASTPSFELLNNLAIFGRRLHFISLHRRGQMVVAKFANGVEAIWPSIADLTCFSRAQAILADATDVLLATPPRHRVRQTWEPAVQLILQLTADGKVTTEVALREEFGHILRSVWERAGSPAACDPAQFVELLKQCNSHQRDPQNGPPACCVWLAEEACWVHQPQLIDFLSTPVGKNKHYPWETVRSALLLLDFQLVKSLTRSASGIIAKANVWRGPAALLMD